MNQQWNVFNSFCLISIDYSNNSIKTYVEKITRNSWEKGNLVHTWEKTIYVDKIFC